MRQAGKSLAQSFAAALAAACLLPSAVFAQAQPNAPVTAPTPAPAPSASGSPIPYPAYGTPAPDVAKQAATPGVPVTVTLQQAIAIAVAQSPVFASERAQYRAIAAKYGAEKGALYPNVSADASVQRQYGGNLSSGSVSPNPSSSPSAFQNNGPFTSITARATLQQLIFDGGRVIAGIRTAKESDFAGRDTLVRQLQTLAFNVAQDYFGVLSAQASVTSNASLVREFETQLNSVSAQIRTGAAARSDLAAAQFQTSQARGQLVVSQGQVITAEATFATVLGLDADTMILPQPVSGPGKRILSYQQAIQEALATRPDYMAAQHTVESAKENLRFAKLGRFPVLTANASAGYSESLPTTLPHLLGSEGLGATLTIPVYDQGLTNYNVALAASQLDQANAGLVQSRLTVQSDVRSALANLISARAAETQAQAELDSAQVNLQAVQARYRVGASSIVELVQAEAGLSTAQRDFVAATYSELLQEENYTYALGTSDLSL